MWSCLHHAGSSTKSGSRKETNKMQEQQKEVRVTARFEYELYSNADDGYCIARYKQVDASDTLPAGSIFIAKGQKLPVQRNALIVLYGEWRADSKHGGRYLAVKFFEYELPSSKDGVVSFLSSLKVGIGPRIATDVYKKFGERVWDVLDNEPDSLTAVRGITQTKVKALKAVLDETRIVRQILAEFRSCEEMTPNRARLIYEKFGAQSLEVIRKNPYVLCQLRGFGFLTVDAIAKADPNWDPERPARLAAGIQTVFQANSTKGHTCVPKAQAVSDLSRMLGNISAEACRNALNQAVKDRKCIVKGDYCYSKINFATERSVAQNVVRLLRNRPRKRPSDQVLDQLIDQFQNENNIELAPLQKDAVRNCFFGNLCIITGGPGTGKSTIIKAILSVAKGLDEEADAVLMAPTGRAARRMQEATGHNASTIHSALGIRYSGEDSRFGEMTESEPLETDYVIVDEVSMVDQHIADCLLSRIGDYTSLILVGDSDQLPSVGAGNVLAELIRSGLVPVTRLNVIFRQKEGDPIIANSRKIRDGETDLMLSRNFRMFDERDPDKIFSGACNFYQRCVKQFGLDNVALLVPHRVKGQLCANTFNAELERRLNPPKEGDCTIKIGSKEFRTGDKVMQTKNTDFAKNGDIGYIVCIEDRPSKESPDRPTRCCDICFDNNSPVTYGMSEMMDVDWAYATSVHKSQGNEFDTVIMVMSGEHELMARRNLFYTGITRAKAHVALIGEAGVFQKAITNCDAETRYTQLAEFIHVVDQSVPHGADPRYYVK